MHYQENFLFSQISALILAVTVAIILHARAGFELGMN